MAIITWKQA